MTTVSGSSRLIQRISQRVIRDNRKSCSRDFATNQDTMMSQSTHFATKEFEEIKFNVPWGHVAAKWYGPKNTRPIVGFHGWQDNAGTFDTIAPMLPSHVGFLAVDLPGHGLSSWLPEGCTYHVMDYVSSVLTLMREFKWDKISMICHSMSSINGFVFCSLFPDKCDMYVGLDILKPVVQSEDLVINTVAEKLQALQKVAARNESKTEPPCYSFDELVDRLYEGSGKSIEKECCQFILKRNIKPSRTEPDKYYFSRDARVKSSLFHHLPQNVVVEMARRITCPHLFIKARQGPYYEKKSHYDEVISLLMEKPNFEYHQIDGKHHVHLNEPKKIADIINPFINKYRPE